jgi:hypothetical protein
MQGTLGPQGAGGVPEPAGHGHMTHDHIVKCQQC